MNGDSNLPTSLHETQLHPNGIRLHMVNIFLFAFVSAVFCIVLHCMFPFPQYTSRDKTAIRLAVLLFVVHPVHTEVVANIVGRCELLSALFMLLSFITYLKCTPSICYRASSFDNNTDSGVTDSKDAPTNTSELTLLLQMRLFVVCVIRCVYFAGHAFERARNNRNWPMVCN